MRSPPTQRHPAFSQTPSIGGTPRCWTLVIAAGLLPLAALLVLFALNVPIGQPDFLIYRYSSFLAGRIARAAPAVLIALVAAALLWKSVRDEQPSRSQRFRAVMSLCYLGLVGWTFVAPPDFVSQHAFNLLSPSHEGAFVLEAREVTSIREYVSRYFYERLQRSPEEMRGRRILSNPPGMTVAAVLCKRAVENTPWLGNAIISVFNLGEVDDPRQRIEFAGAMLLAILMTVAWGASILPAYWLCRLWLPQTAAICVALAMAFNPATTTFTPGKDPAQVLTAVVILAGWVGAYVRGKWLFGAIAGTAVAAGTMIGLVHVWVLIIAAAGTFAHAAAANRKQVRDWLSCCALPSALAAGGVAAIAALTLDWNVPRTVRAVASRYGEIQLPIITDPFYWTLVGLPMFLLFVGPLFWIALIALRREPSTGGSRRAGTSGTPLLSTSGCPPAGTSGTFDPTGSLGQWMAWSTAAVMTYSYFFANNSETPRLWMPLIPPLLLGMALRRGIFRDDSAASRRLMVLIIALQVLVTVAFWSLMDVRESEWRLATGRMWD